MCYDVAYMKHRELGYAERYGETAESIQELKEALETLFPPVTPVYHTTGFTFPKIPVITNDKADSFQMFEWGLIAPWIKDTKSLQQSRYKYHNLNAKAETLFEKRSYKSAAA